MGKFHVTVRTKFGEISVEGDSKKEVLDLLSEAVGLIEDTKDLLPEEIVSVPTPFPMSTMAKKEIAGMIEVTDNGRPHVVVAPEKLSAKEVIGLLLYWKHPDGLSMNELTNFVSLNWKAVDQPRVSSYIAKMRGLVLKEGPKGKYVYKLSGTGRSLIESKLLPKLRGEKD